MKSKFTLYKNSLSGFELKTNHIEVVLKVLEEFICSDYKIKNMKLYNKLNDSYSVLLKAKNFKYQEKYINKIRLIIVYILLGTDCGSEFLFDDENDENYYEIMEELEELGYV